MYPIEWEAGQAQEVNRMCWRKLLALPGMGAHGGADC